MSFAAFGRWAARHRFAISLAALAFCLLSAGLNLAANGKLTGSGYVSPQIEAAQAFEAARGEVGRGAPDIVAIFRDTNRQATDPAFRAHLEESLAAVPPGIVTGTVTPWSLGQPGLVSADLHAVAVIITLAGADDDQRQQSYGTLQKTLHHQDFQISYLGPAAVLSDLVDRSRHDLILAELIALPLMAALLLVLFRNILAALLPVVIGGLAVLATFGILRALAPSIPISVLALNAVSVLSLALSIDAGLLVVGRFREELARQATVAKAVEATTATAGKAVCLSSLTIAAISIGMTLSGIGLIISIGLGMAISQLIAAVLSITVLPALLALIGTRLGSARKPASTRYGWVRLANAVMARPVSYFVGVCSVLVILAAPSLHARLSFPDQNMLPESAPPNIAAADLKQNFKIAGADVVHVVTTFAHRIDSAEGARSLKNWIYKLGAVPRISRVVLVATAGTTAVIYVRPLEDIGKPPQDGAAQLVRNLRQLPKPDGAQVLIGGEAATAMDTMAHLGNRLPAMAVYTIAVILLIVMLAIRSLILPLKAVLMALISTGTAMGVTVLSFQDGYLQRLLGHPSIPYVDVFTALIMVMILIGLSVDYTYILLSRIREHYIATGDPEAAVAHGIQRSGRVVTAAALSVIVVAAVFLAVSEVESLRQLCLGLLVAVVIDVTLVRMFLLPASMKLLGRANWWWPGEKRPAAPGAQSGFPPAARGRGSCERAFARLTE